MQVAYDQKISEARAIIEEHNALSKSDLDWNKILANLQKMGGTTEDSLREMSWEDLQDAGVPRILARRIANRIFRRDIEQPLTADRVSAMSFFELFQHYDPSGEMNYAVRERLQKESGGKRCVAFDPNDESKVLANESAKALRQLKDGLPEQQSIIFEGKPVKLYRIGQRPNELIHENFLFPGQALRDGVCDYTGRRLADIPHEAQQIIYLAITETKELVINDVEAAHRILDVTVFPDSSGSIVNKIQSRFPKAALLLRELEEEGTAPKLLIRRGPLSGALKRNDPFNTASHQRT